jgi:hypothetical protein
MALGHASEQAARPSQRGVVGLIIAWRYQDQPPPAVGTICRPASLDAALPSTHPNTRPTRDPRHEQPPKATDETQLEPALILTRPQARDPRLT